MAQLFPTLKLPEFNIPEERMDDPPPYEDWEEDMMEGPVLFESKRHSTPSITCFYVVVARRPPKKGEWYLSGAIPAAYLATHDLGTDYPIVKPTFRAVLKTIYVRGEKIDAKFL